MEYKITVWLLLISDWCLATALSYVNEGYKAKQYDTAALYTYLKTINKGRKTPKETIKSFMEMTR